MIFYTLDKYMITTPADTIEELISYVMEDVYTYPESSISFSNEEQEVSISREEIEKCLIISWDAFCLKKYGVPHQFLNIQDNRVKQDYANYEREKKEHDEMLVNLITSKTKDLFGRGGETS